MRNGKVKSQGVGSLLVLEETTLSLSQELLAQEIIAYLVEHHQHMF